MIPEPIKAAVREELAALVRGEGPDQATWISGYGERGAVLVEQPEAIWDDPSTEMHPMLDGGRTSHAPRRPRPLATGVRRLRLVHGGEQHQLVRIR